MCVLVSGASLHAGKPKSDVDEAFEQAVKAAVATPKQKAEIASLIRLLGSPDFDTREMAEDQLVRMGFIAYPYLKNATRSRDIEVGQRAFRAMQRMRDRTHVILDATGKPMVGATLRQRVDDAGMPYASSSEVRTRFAGFANVQWARDGRGGKQQTLAEISHPAYGTAIVPIDMSASKVETIVAPLVPRSSALVAVAWRGRVVDEQGRPVKGAIVAADDARVDGKQRLKLAFTPRVLTNAEGRFTLYPPVATKAGVEPEPLPRGVSAVLHVTPPDPEKRFPTAVAIDNDGPVTISVRTPTQSHQLAFEELGGGVLPDDQFRHVEVHYQADRNSPRLPLHPGHVAVSTRLLPGIYHARLKSLSFQPVTVTSASPRTILFERPPSTQIVGRVVDGRNGDGLEGAAVIAFSGTPSNLSLLSDKEIDTLRKAIRDVGSRGEKAIDMSALGSAVKGSALLRSLRIDSFAATTREGRFVLTELPERQFKHLAVLRKDYLPMWSERRSLKKRKDGLEAGSVALYPAARIEYQLTTWSLQSQRWLLAEGEQPDWARQLEELRDSRGWRLADEGNVTSSKRSMLIPAEARVYVRIEPRSIYAPITLGDPFELDQGKTHKIRRLKMERGVSLRVHVTDAGNKPANRQAVVYRDTNGIVSSPVPTNSRGEAYLWVTRNQSYTVFVPGHEKATARTVKTTQRTSTKKVEIRLPK